MPEELENPEELLRVDLLHAIRIHSVSTRSIRPAGDQVQTHPCRRMTFEETSNRGIDNSDS
jgi:hypothetical protein